MTSSLIVPNTFTASTPVKSAEVNANFDAIETWADAIPTGDLADDAVTNDKLDSTTVNVPLGLSETGVVRRGASIIATSETTTSATYTTLTTPDRVQNVVLPSNGLIAVLFQGIWKESTADTARIAIFIGATQLKIQTAQDASPVTQAAVGQSGYAGNGFRTLVSFPGGLVSPAAGTGVASDVTTGQAVAFLDTGSTGGSQQTAAEFNGTKRTIISGTTLGSPVMGGPCFIHAAAGTYTVSIQYKISGGETLTAKERKLWVWTLGF
jgi:hypothetical protein